MTAAHEAYMQLALEQAQQAAARGEVPIGAVVVDSTGAVLTACGNQTEASHDPTAHAEVLAIRAACALRQSPRLPDCDLYVTLEPCPLCATAISFARLRHVYFGAFDPKGGGVEHGPCIFHQPTCHHKPLVTGGILHPQCGSVLQTFFAERRQS
jgi:tRNA(Arg) A34 adenosine deaminase TadA